MKNDRLQVPIDEAYLQAVGLAAFCFARLEWMVVWCCQKIECNYLQTIEKKTAGMIAKDFIQFTKKYPDSDLAVSISLQAAAEKFKSLVIQRNALMHAKPGTSSKEAQRLFRHEVEWTIPMINDLADEFAEHEIILNNYFYNHTC